MATVRRIQQLRTGKMSLNRIATLLQSEGVATKNGGAWRTATVDSVLKVHAKAA